MSSGFGLMGLTNPSNSFSMPSTGGGFSMPSTMPADASAGGFDPSNLMSFGNTGAQNAGAAALAGTGGSTGVSGISGVGPGVGDAAKGAAGSFGFNVPTLGLALGGIQTLGNLYMAGQALDLAKKQFSMQRDFGEQNLANSMQSYNTQLGDRVNNRVYQEQGTPQGLTQAQGDAYLAKNQLVRRRTS